MDKTEFVPAHPKQVTQSVQVEEGNNDDQDRSYQWKRLFLMYYHHEFFNASPQHPQISYKQHQRKKRKKKKTKEGRICHT